jgi:hypothetical protein
MRVGFILAPRIEVDASIAAGADELERSLDLRVARLRLLGRLTPSQRCLEACVAALPIMTVNVIRIGHFAPPSTE